MARRGRSRRHGRPSALALALCARVVRLGSSVADLAAVSCGRPRAGALRLRCPSRSPATGTSPSSPSARGRPPSTASADGAAHAACPRRPRSANAGPRSVFPQRPSVRVRRTPPPSRTGRGNDWGERPTPNYPLFDFTPLSASGRSVSGRRRAESENSKIGAFESCCRHMFRRRLHAHLCVWSRGMPADR